jgi:hypothetical protein
VAKAGLLAGILDITATGLKVVVFGSGTARRLLQGIASGVLGPTAFEGGWPVAGLGLMIHFTIAGIWAAIFALAATRLAAFSRVRSIGAISAVGLGYGAVVWMAMDFVVLAHSRARPVPVTSAAFWLQLAIHMVCVGLPIAVTLLKRNRGSGLRGR